jgi:hypothetical protein
MAAGDNAGDRCQDGGVALAGAGGRAIGGSGIEIAFALSSAAALMNFWATRLFVRS